MEIRTYEQARDNHGKLVSFIHPDTNKLVFGGRISSRASQETWGVLHNSLNGGSLPLVKGFHHDKESGNSGSWCNRYQGIPGVPLRRVCLDETSDDNSWKRVMGAYNNAPGIISNPWRKEKHRREQTQKNTEPQANQMTSIPEDTYSGIKIKKKIQWR